MRVEIGSQICDDGVGKAELVQDVADEANQLIYTELCNGLYLVHFMNLSMATNT
jgi:hypothetical protein